VPRRRQSAAWDMANVVDTHPRNRLRRRRALYAAARTDLAPTFKCIPTSVIAVRAGSSTPAERVRDPDAPAGPLRPEARRHDPSLLVSQLTPQCIHIGRSLTLTDPGTYTPLVGHLPGHSREGYAYTQG